MFAAFLHVVGGAVLFLSLGEAALAQPAPTPPPDAETLFTGFSPETFRTLPATAQRIDFDRINNDLLSAAVFHETNQRRKQNGLPALRHETKLRNMAEMQAGIMSARGTLTPESPGTAGKEATAARLRLAGLQVGFFAESCSTAFGVTYKNGQPVYPRNVDGKKFVSREPAGGPIPAHTYLSFATALLDDLMASPHRQSILSPKPAFLGISCRLKVNEVGMPLFYCAHEFYTPPLTVPGTR